MVKIPFQLQKRLKKNPKISNFEKISNDLKFVSRHCGGHYNIKFRHSEDFSGRAPPPCQIGLNDSKDALWYKENFVQFNW